MTVEDGPTEMRSTGTYMIEPQSGIVLSGAVSSERDDAVFKHLYTTSLTEVMK